MTPSEYEAYVASHFDRDGWKTTMTPGTNDYGVDIFATKGSERLAIQVKMYGGSSRPVNRDMIMHLYAARDYFDCTKAVLVTDGRITTDATVVAAKLGVEVRHLEARASVPAIASQPSESSRNDGFDEIWQKYIMPLAGRTLTAPDGRTNQILKVDWSGLERRSSSGALRKIPVEIFRLTVNHLLKNGAISRQAINDEYAKRASSGIVLILSQVPMFEYVSLPVGLRLRG